MPHAKIIAIVNQKGGPGKSTVAMVLAGTLGRRGCKVLVVDADSEQGSATRWAASAPDDVPFPASIAGLGKTDAKLHREVQKFVADHDYIVIDCPPSANSPVAQSALLIADLALVPVVPSPLDLWAGVAISKVIDAAAALNEHLTARLLINRQKPNTRLAAETRKILSAFAIPLCKTQLGDREVYKHAAAYGQTVQGLGTGATAAITEVEALTDELLSVLKGETDHGQRSAKRRAEQITAR